TRRLAAVRAPPRRGALRVEETTSRTSRAPWRTRTTICRSRGLQAMFAQYRETRRARPEDATAPRRALRVSGSCWRRRASRFDNRLAIERFHFVSTELGPSGFRPAGHRARNDSRPTSVVILTSVDRAACCTCRGEAAPSVIPLTSASDDASTDVCPAHARASAPPRARRTCRRGPGPGAL